MSENSNFSKRLLSNILKADECTVACSVFDPVSARLARHIGSDVGVLGGSAASQVILGAPDIVVMTASELVEQSRRICRTQCVNLIVDADHGYGNALNMMRTIEELQAAGVAGACIEDSILPRQFGADEQQGLISLEEGERKVQAALQARGNGPMLVFGRTNAIATTGLNDAIKRLQAYEKLGVDALFLPYLKSREELDEIACAVTLPLLVVGGDESLFDLDYLRQRRVKIWMWGHQPLTVATAQLLETMKAAQRGVPPSQLLKGIAPEVVQIATAAQDYNAQIKKYL